MLLHLNFKKKHGIKPNEIRTYTFAQVAKHSEEKNLWLIIDDRVFDVTEYVDAHPGGIAIMRSAGGDNTQGFNGDQHPDNVYDVLAPFYIGDMKTDESKKKS